MKREAQPLGGSFSRTAVSNVAGLFGARVGDNAELPSRQGVIGIGPMTLLWCLACHRREPKTLMDVSPMGKDPPPKFQDELLRRASRLGNTAAAKVGGDHPSFLQLKRRKGHLALINDWWLGIWSLVTRENFGSPSFHPFLQLPRVWLCTALIILLLHPGRRLGQR